MVFIEKDYRDPSTGEPQSALFEHSLNLAKDIVIEAVNPLPHPWLDAHRNTYLPGVRRYLPDSDFSRSEGIGNPKDFRWVVNLGDHELHGKPLTVTTPPKSRIFINDGLLYTEKLPDEHFATVLLEDASQKLFGRMAHYIGLDIIAPKVLIGNKDAAAFALEPSQDVSYRITIENRCLRPAESNTAVKLLEDGLSDFVFYYETISAPDGKKFDFQSVERNEGITEFGTPLVDNAEFSLCGIPDPCHPALPGP